MRKKTNPGKGTVFFQKAFILSLFGGCLYYIVNQMNIKTLYSTASVRERRMHYAIVFILNPKYRRFLCQYPLTDLAGTEL